MHAIFIQYIYLILIILGLVMLANKLRVAYPIVVVLGGLLLSVMSQFSSITIDPEVVFFLFPTASSLRGGMESFVERILALASPYRELCFSNCHPQCVGDRTRIDRSDSRLHFGPRIPARRHHLTPGCDLRDEYHAAG